MTTRTLIRLLSAGIPAILLLSSCVPSRFQAHLTEALMAPPVSSLSPMPQYYSPLGDAKYVSKGAAIIIRYGPLLSSQIVEQLDFLVEGSRSGRHTGQVILADDNRTIIFKPDLPFEAGEKVVVNISALQLDPETTYPAISYIFTVAVNQQPGTPGSSQLADPPIPANAPRSAFPDFLTVPQDIPHFVISTTSSEDTDVFLAPFYWTESTVGSYLLILNHQGQLVYYQSVADALDAWDFKQQPNGLLSYYDQKDSTIYVMNSHYEVVDTFRAGDGYTSDLHDFQMLPNGNALLMIYDAETIDMRAVAPGGRQNAVVTGLVIQELDPSKNVIFEWRSWDHFTFDDSISNLTDENIDLIHGNSLALSTDGNLLLSSRNLNEVTKIDLQTGDILWRLGGRENMFKFVNGEPFAYQHDVRQLPNGNLTVFDNHGTPERPAPSRGVEYRLDEVNKTATEVWEYELPSVFSTFMGNAQRLPDGNTLLSWGAPYTKGTYTYRSITEVSPDNRTVFDLVLDQPYVSYRAFVFPWHGYPNTLPTLAYKLSESSITLGYSWNGATEVAGYQVFAGDDPDSLALIERKTKMDFETQTRLDNPPTAECYFQVAAVDRNDNELARSKVISTNPHLCPLVP